MSMSQSLYTAITIEIKRYGRDEVFAQHFEPQRLTSYMYFNSVASDRNEQRVAENPFSEWLSSGSECVDA